MKLKKGDNVVVIAGKDRGKKGKIQKVYPAASLVIVEGVNKRKKHQRPTRGGQKGEVIEKTEPIDVSNVQFVDPETGKGTRIGLKLVGERYVRVAKASGKEI